MPDKRHAQACDTTAEDLAMLSEVAVGEAHAPADSSNQADVMYTTFKVASSSRPHLLAGGIAAVLRHGQCTHLQCVGAGAVNQAVKAVIIARRFLREDALDARLTPSFLDITIGDQDRTALVLTVEGLRQAVTDE
jgi:stage V sporulation protein S